MMNYKNKICDFFSSNLNKIGILILFYIFLISLFASHETFVVYNEAHNFNAFILLLGMIIMIGIMIRYATFLENAKKKTVIYIMIIMSVLLVCVQIIYVYNFTYINYTDLSTVHSEAVDLIKYGSIEKSNYLSQYTNNIPITLFLYGIYKATNILGITCYKYIGIGVNIISIDICMILLCLLVKQKYGLKKAALILGLILINPIVYVYLPTYYTNSLALVFYALLLFLYNCFLKNRKIRYIFLFGIVAILGIKMRATVGIMLIAIICSMIINFKLKDFLKCISVIIICLLIGNGIYGLVENKFIKFDYSETQYPVTHWLMMGSKDSSSFGGYNKADDNFTHNFKTYDEKVTATTNKFVERISEYGIEGNIKRLNEKYIRLFSIGTYGFRQSSLNVEKFTKIYPYILGERSIFFNYYLQIMHITILFLAIVVCIKNHKNYKFGLKKICILFILGTFLFYTFWESDSRYSLMLVPILIFLSTNGIKLLTNQINNEKEKLDKILIIKFDGNKEIKKEYIFRCIRKLKNILVLVIIVVLALNYGKYTKNLINEYDWSVNNYKTNAADTIKNTDILYQTFITNKVFNRAEIAINNEDVNKKDKIQIKIIDNLNNKEIYNKVMTLGEFDKDGILKLKFNEIKPMDSIKYTISIEAINVDDKLEINKFYKGNSKQVSGGSMSINGEGKSGNIQFKVYKEYKATFMTSKRYVLFSMIIIFISVVSLYGQSIFKNVKHKIKKISKKEYSVGQDL